MKKQLVIFGSAEIAELAYYYFQHDSNYEVIAFTVDDDFVKVSSSKHENQYQHRIFQEVCRGLRAFPLGN